MFRGEQLKGFYAILKGRVTGIYKRSDRVLLAHETYETFGHECMLSARSRLTYRSLEDTVCMFFPIELVNLALDMSNKDLVYFRRLAKLRLKRIDYLIKEFKRTKKNQKNESTVNKPSRKVNSAELSSQDARFMPAMTESPDLVVRDGESPSSTGEHINSAKLIAKSTKGGCCATQLEKLGPIEVSVL